MAPHQPHLKILSNLIKRIYTGKLMPGEKLPPLRQLTEEMGADPATVRIALKQLEAMNVLEIRRSDGAYVKDFRKHGGLDFLVTLIMYEKLDGEKPVADEFLRDEINEFWIILMPAMMKMADPKYTPRHIKRLMDIFDEELEVIGDEQKVVDLEMQSQDLVIEVADNIVATLLFNSIRPLRKKMAELFAMSVDEEDQREFLMLRKELTRRRIAGTVFDGEGEANLERFRDSLRRFHHAVQQMIAEGHSFPSKTSLNPEPVPDGAAHAGKDIH
jgi:GntR family transcriptional repressor for pyruvate dehydrogenase complex